MSISSFYHFVSKSQYSQNSAMPFVQEVADLQLQREKLQKENEQIFTFLTRKGYFMARQPSPVVLGARNADKQAELAEMCNQLNQILLSSNQKLVEMIEWIHAARQQVTQRVGSASDWSELEQALSILEQKVNQCMSGPGIQPNESEIQYSILVSDIERLNQEKKVLQNCQLGGYHSAFELQQLLKTLENEYEELDQRCLSCKKNLIQAKEDLSKKMHELQIELKRVQVK